MSGRVLSADEARQLLIGATEGPWEVGVASGWVGSARVVTEMYVRRPGDNVAIAAQVIDPRTEEISESNANLLAAAPDLAATVIAQAEKIAELLASIEDAQGHLSSVHALDCEQPDTAVCSNCDVEKARKALTKAVSQ